MEWGKSSDEEPPKQKAVEVSKFVTENVHKIMNAISVTESCCQLDTADEVINATLNDALTAHQVEDVDPKVSVKVRLSNVSKTVCLKDICTPDDDDHTSTNRLSNTKNSNEKIVVAEQSIQTEMKKPLKRNDAYTQDIYTSVFRAKGLLRSPEPYPNNRPYEPYLKTYGKGSDPIMKVSKESAKAKEDGIQSAVTSTGEELKDGKPELVGKNNSKNLESSATRNVPKSAQLFEQVTTKCTSGNVQELRVYQNYDFSDDDGDNRKSSKAQAAPTVEEIAKTLELVISESPNKALLTKVRKAAAAQQAMRGQPSTHSLKSPMHLRKVKECSNRMKRNVIAKKSKDTNVTNNSAKSVNLLLDDVLNPFQNANAANRSQLDEKSSENIQTILEQTSKTSSNTDVSAERSTSDRVPGESTSTSIQREHRSIVELIEGKLIKESPSKLLENTKPVQQIHHNKKSTIPIRSEFKIKNLGKKSKQESNSNRNKNPPPTERKFEIPQFNVRNENSVNEKTETEISGEIHQSNMKAAWEIYIDSKFPIPNNHTSSLEKNEPYSVPPNSSDDFNSIPIQKLTSKNMSEENTLSDIIMRKANENLKTPQSVYGSKRNSKNREMSKEMLADKAKETKTKRIKDNRLKSEEKDTALVGIDQVSKNNLLQNPSQTSLAVKGNTSWTDPNVFEKSASTQRVHTHLINIADAKSNEYIFDVSNGGACKKNNKYEEDGRLRNNRNTQTPKEVIQVACVHAPDYATLKRSRLLDNAMPPEYFTVDFRYIDVVHGGNQIAPTICNESEMHKSQKAAPNPFMPDTDETVQIYRNKMKLSDSDSTVCEETLDGFQKRVRTTNHDLPTDTPNSKCKDAPTWEDFLKLNWSSGRTSEDGVLKQWETIKRSKLEVVTDTLETTLNGIFKEEGIGGDDAKTEENESAPKIGTHPSYDSLNAPVVQSKSDISLVPTRQLIPKASSVNKQFETDRSFNATDANSVQEVELPSRGSVVIDTACRVDSKGADRLSANRAYKFEEHARHSLNFRNPKFVRTTEEADGNRKSVAESGSDLPSKESGKIEPNFKGVQGQMKAFDHYPTFTTNDRNRKSVEKTGRDLQSKQSGTSHPNYLFYRDQMIAYIANEINRKSVEERASVLAAKQFDQGDPKTKLKEDQPNTYVMDKWLAEKLKAKKLYQQLTANKANPWNPTRYLSSAMATKPNTQLQDEPPKRDLVGKYYLQLSKHRKELEFIEKSQAIPTRNEGKTVSTTNHYKLPLKSTSHTLNNKSAYEELKANWEEEQEYLLARQHSLHTLYKHFRPMHNPQGHPIQRLVRRLIAEAKERLKEKKTTADDNSKE